MNMGRGWIGVLVALGVKEANAVLLAGLRVCFEVVSFVENALREVDTGAGINADDASKRCQIGRAHV